MQETPQATLDDTDMDDRTKVRVMNIICLVSAALAILSAIIGRDSLPYVISLISLAGIFFITLAINNLQSNFPLTGYFATFFTTAWIVYMCFAFADGLGMQNYLTIALVALAIFSRKRVYRAVSIVVLISLAVLLNMYQRYCPPLFDLPQSTDLLFAINVVTPLTLVALMCLQVLRDMRRTSAVIEKQNVQLAETNQFKDKIFSIIGHDMRAPFNSARSLVELLEDDLLTPEERKAALGQLQASIDVSLQTLDNLLGWASQGYYGSVLKTKTLIERLEVGPLVEKTMQLLAHPAAQKNIRFINEVLPGIVVAADLEQLSFVLRNIAGNAIKFSYTGQAITFTACENGDTVVIAVHDTGVGMTKSMISALFRIATRFSKEGTVNEKGSGLGLIFCNEFIENNHGRLWIESEPGQGTTVSFSLPKPS
jgi:signal transduction histidine kinase